MTTKITKSQVLIVDDHPILRQGIAQLINQEGDLQVCGQASEAQQALELLRKTKCHIVLLDISLNGANGLELLKDIKLRFPKLPVLILSMHEESIYGQRVLRGGASGYVMKLESPANILQAIRKVLSGGIYLSAKLNASLINHMGGTKTISRSPVEELSNRELEIFTLIGQGNGTRAISEKLKLSVKTIESHRTHIKEKLNLTTATELVHYAIQWHQSENFGPTNNAR